MLIWVMSARFVSAHPSGSSSVEDTGVTLTLSLSRSRERELRFLKALDDDVEAFDGGVEFLDGVGGEFVGFS